MKRCDHNKVYSGRINLERKFEWICRSCGEYGWSEDYLVDQVDLHEFYAQRVVHGWSSPMDRMRLRVPLRLPAPPRVPTNVTPQKSWAFFPGVVFFALLPVVCAAAAIPWGALGPIMPPWMALIASGVALGTATVLFVAWKKGL